MADVEMPQLGETVTEGTITRWFKAVGDNVAEDEPLFEVSTDKVDSEVPSPVSGTVREILVPEGDTVVVGTKLAVVGDAPTPAGGADGAEADGTDQNAPAPAPTAAATGTETAPPPSQSAPSQSAPSQSAPSQSAPSQPESSTSQSGGATSNGRARLLSPVVRKLVRDNDVDVDAVAGTGPGGRVTRDDVLDAIDAGSAKRSPGGARDTAPAPTMIQPPSPAVRAGERDTRVPHSRIRQATAAHMRRSVDTSAHVYASIEVDFEAVEVVRRDHKAAFKADEGFSLTYLPFVARAVVDAVREFPEVNATFGDDELIVHNYVNLGIAVDLDFKGLLVPVIADADGMRLRAIARSVRDLAARTRSKKLSPDELSGGTFTITNPGPFGTTMTMPIISQPQVAILSTDGITRRPVVVPTTAGGEAIAIHSVGNLTLAWDHRAFDGAYAAGFLKQTKDHLETMDWAQELG